MSVHVRQQKTIAEQHIKLETVTSDTLVFDRSYNHTEDLDRTIWIGERLVGVDIEDGGESRSAVADRGHGCGFVHRHDVCDITGDYR